VDCDRQALQWSLKKETPPERIQVDYRKGFVGCRYSLELTDYEPRCSHCHLVYDGNPRGAKMAAMWRSKTHCPHGHEYTEENTRLRKGGGRACRIRERAGHRTWVAKRRATQPEKARAYDRKWRAKMRAAKKTRTT
jgi:hypothetical protein